MASHLTVRPLPSPGSNMPDRQFFVPPNYQVFEDSLSLFLVGTTSYSNLEAYVLQYHPRPIESYVHVGDNHPWFWCPVGISLVTSHRVLLLDEWEIIPSGPEPEYITRNVLLVPQPMLAYHDTAPKSPRSLAITIRELRSLSIAIILSYLTVRFRKCEPPPPPTWWWWDDSVKVGQVA